jgi:hypothetical protein
MAQAPQAVNLKVDKPVPKFLVEDGGSYKRRIATYNKEKKTFEYSTIDEPSSYLLKFPKGHSIRVRTRAELERLVGDPEHVELVDLETSDVVGVQHRPLKKKGE